jgi:hypothetical protein
MGSYGMNNSNVDMNHLGWIWGTSLNKFKIVTPYDPNSNIWHNNVWKEMISLDNINASPHIMRKYGIQYTVPNIQKLSKLLFFTALALTDYNQNESRYNILSRFVGKIYKCNYMWIEYFPVFGDMTYNDMINLIKIDSPLICNSAFLKVIQPHHIFVYKY